MLVVTYIVFKTAFAHVGKEEVMFTYKDLPMVLRETELLTLSDGTELRFESNGGAQDVFVNDEWTSRASLFQGMSHDIETTSGEFRITAEPEGMRVEPK